MTNFQTILKNIKSKSWLVYLIIVISILLILSAIMRALTPKSPQVPSSQLNQGNTETNKRNYQQLEYVGQYPEKPTKMAIAQAQVLNLKTQLISQLTTQFNLEQDDSNNLWLGDNYSFSLQDNNHIILSKNYTNNSTERDQKTELALEEALKIAKDFVVKNLSQYQVKPFVKEALFLDNAASEYKQSSAERPQDEKAKIIIIPFNYSLDGYPILYQDSHLPFVEILVEAGRGVTKATFNLRGASYQKIDEMPVLSLDQVLLNITQKNRAQLISYDHTYAQEVTMDQIASGKLRTARIEYRLDEENKLIYPFYRFSGDFINTDGQNFSGELIAPAVEIEAQ